MVADDSASISVWSTISTLCSYCSVCLYLSFGFAPSCHSASQLFFCTGTKMLTMEICRTCLPSEQKPVLRLLSSTLGIVPLSHKMSAALPKVRCTDADVWRSKQSWSCLLLYPLANVIYVIFREILYTLPTSLPLHTIFTLHIPI